MSHFTYEHLPALNLGYRRLDVWVTGGIGLHEIPSVLLIKRESSQKTPLKTTRLADQVRGSRTHLAVSPVTQESSMNTGTFEPSLTRSSEMGDLGRASQEGDLTYASRDGTDEMASKRPEISFRPAPWCSSSAIFSSLSTAWRGPRKNCTGWRSATT